MTPPYGDYYQRRLHAKYSPTKGIPDVLHRDFGFSTLPDKYDRLNRLFNEMEKVLQITFGRDQRTTFAQLAANVEKNSGRKFTMNHLAQINSLYPDAYMIKWEKPRNKRIGVTEQWDLVIKQNVQGNKDIAPFFTNKTLDEISPTKLSAPQTVPTNQPLSPVKQLISPIKSRRDRDFILRSPTKRPKSIVVCPSTPDTRVKMDAKRMMWRKMIFRHLLVERVRKAHDTFLEDKNLSHSDDQDVHQEFKKVINKITSDIPSSLPQKPVGSELRDSDIRTFLQCLSKTPSKVREKTPERLSEPVVKSEPQTPKNILVKAEPQTPKTPFEQRLKAKFAAKAAVRNVNVSELQKRRGMLYRMKDDGILEVIRAHLNMNQSTTIGLGNRELLQKLGREINALLLLDHLKLLCELVPKELCWLEPLNPSSGAEGYLFRISADIGPKWFPKVLEIIAKEIASLDQKLEPLTTPKMTKSPSSFF